MDLNNLEKKKIQELKQWEHLKFNSCNKTFVIITEGRYEELTRDRKLLTQN